MRENFFMERVVKHRNRLPREVVGSPSLEVFQKHEVALGDTIKWWAWQYWRNGWTCLKVFSNLNDPMFMPGE